MESSISEFYGNVIHSYSRADAIGDGILIDVTKEASSETGMIGGFCVPVCVTAAVWHDIQSIPPDLEGLQDVRGRLHDVLWLAALACRRGSGSETLFSVLLEVADSEQQEREYRLVCGPGDSGEPVVTILVPDED